MDASRSRIRDTSVFFPEKTHQFANLPIEQFSDLDRNLPGTYDFVYWNVWDDYLFDAPDRVDIFKMAFDRVKDGGRLMMGFYDRDPDVIAEKISLIHEIDLGASVRMDNPDGPQIMMCLDKV
jgi:hypothetical protein